MHYHHVPLDYPYTTVGIVLPIRIDDNSGMAHILEHVLLCGSKKYPYNDLFFSTRANHIVNDINAATFANRIILHATAWNKAELDSIIDIYTSIIHSPLLTQHDFEREGIRQSTTGLNGIVYNEMFSAAKADSEFYPLQSAYAGLFEDARKFNANGDPNELKDCTYEDMLRFWQSNCLRENSLIITVGSLYSEKTSDNIALPPPTERSSNLGISIQDQDTKNRLYAWRLGDLDDPVSYCDALSVKSLLSIPEAPFRIDETFGDVVLLSPLNGAKLITLSAAADVASLQRGQRSLLTPGDQFRPTPLQWLHRLAAAYAIDRRLLTIEYWRDSIHRRTQCWLDENWRISLLEELFKLSELTLATHQPSLIAPNAMPTQAPDTPIQQFHHRRVTLDNPFVYFDFNEDDSLAPIDENAPHRLVEHDAMNSNQSIARTIEMSDSAALYCGVFIATPTLSIDQEAVLHILCAYWGLTTLHPVIRRTYGAYGAIARYRNNLGISIITYRDPSVVKSLELIEDLIKKRHSIIEEPIFALSKNEVLSQLSPRPNAKGYIVNKERVRSEREWQRLEALWSRVNLVTLSEYNNLLKSGALDLTTLPISAAMR